MPNDASILGKLILPEIRELIESGDFATLGDVLNDYLPADLASIVVGLPANEQPLIIDALRPRHAATTFEYLDLPTQERLLEAFGHKKQAEILNEMAPDDRTALLEDLPSEPRTNCWRFCRPSNWRLPKVCWLIGPRAWAG